MKTVLLFLFISVNISLAQNPYSIEYTIESGLPTSNIYASFQDHKGYIWFATDVGVLKFNGYEFTHFNTDDGLADNEVFRIFEDSKNRIWFLTLNGRLSYYKDGKFINSKTSKKLETASHQKMIIDYFEDKDGTLYFLYRNGKVSILNSKLDSVKIYNNVSPTYSIFKQNNRIKFLSAHSIKHLKSKDSVSLKKEMMPINGYRFYSKKDEFYFSTNSKVYQYKNESFDKILDVNKSDIIFISIIDNNYWVGTRSGLYVKKGKLIIRYFKDDIVSGVIKDMHNNIWVTTLNNGIKFIPNLDLISYPLGEKKKINSLKKDIGNNLWIGSNKGLLKLKKNSYSPKLVSSDKIYIKRIRYYNSSIYAVCNNFIDVYHKNYNKRLSFGTNDILIDKSEYFLSSSIVFKLTKENFNRICKDLNNKIFKNLSMNQIFEKRTNVLAKKEDGSVYFGASTGLYSYTNNVVKKLKSANDELNTSILDILLDEKENKVFLATNSKGMLALNSTNNKVEISLNSLNGLNSNGCNAIKKYDDKTYYIATSKGLNQLLIEDDNYKVFDYNHRLGLKGETINDLETIDSVLYLATNKELLSFNLNLKKKKVFAPELVIESFTVNDEKNKDFLNLMYTENNIKIKYTGISFLDFEKLIYAYKFEKDKDWITTKNRQLDFKDLPHGNYNLQIKVKSNNSDFSEVKYLKFRIKPPFWKTYIFTTLCMVFLVFMLYFLWRYRIEKIQSRFEIERQSLKIKEEKITLEKQMVELKQKALRLQMNPHFIFNALNTIKGYYSGGEIIAANKYISKFSRLLRFILESDEHLISLKKEIETLNLYIKLVQLRYPDAFKYSIIVDENISIDEIGIPPLLIQPIIENAILHGLIPKDDNGLLKVLFNKEKDKLVCIVFDNGVGFPEVKKQKKHNSKALKITQDRVNFENNNIDENNLQIVHHKNPNGTEIIIKIPLKEIPTNK